LKTAGDVRFRLTALLAATTLAALLAAAVGPAFRKLSPQAQWSLAAYWIVTLLVATAGFAWQWRRSLRPAADMGTVRWQAKLRRRQAWLEPVVRVAVALALASWLASEAAQVGELTDRFAYNGASRWFAVAVRGGAMGTVIGMILLPQIFRPPAFVCERGVWTLRRTVVWSKLKSWGWLSDRPGVMKLGVAPPAGMLGDVYLAIAAEDRAAVEDFVREKTELTIPSKCSL
jgi:hypothetical protein